MLESEFLDSLNNIHLIFLPPKVTSVYQPCDQQLFYSIESKYRRLLALHKATLFDDDKHELLVSLCNGNETIETVDIIMREVLKLHMTNALKERVSEVTVWK